MDKLAQQDDPLLSSPIGSEELIMGVWNKYFADKHKDAVSNLRALIQKDPGLQAELTQMFPGWSWPEFADTPTKDSLGQIASTMERIMDNKRVQMSEPTFNALQAYMAQYNAVLDTLKQRSGQTPARSKKPIPASPKVKQLQQLLGVPATGLWNQQSNAAFLNWLKANKWDKYISGNKFTGKIDDAIRAMLVEKASPEAAKPAEDELIEHGPPSLPAAKSSRQERLERLKKLG